MITSQRLEELASQWISVGDPRLDRLAAELSCECAGMYRVSVSLATGDDGETDLRVELQETPSDQPSVFRWRHPSLDNVLDYSLTTRRIRGRLSSADRTKALATDTSKTSRDDTAELLSVLKKHRAEYIDRVESAAISGRDQTAAKSILSSLESKISATSMALRSK